MKNIDVNNFKIAGKCNLSEIPTKLDLEISEAKKEKFLDKQRKGLSKIQDKMYAHNKYGVLICLQGMDTAGKDSLVREVFKEFNARGVVVNSFKTPTSKELEHDFLWRHYVVLPERGKFSVFNRSHYENVLISRVHKQIVLNENLPEINSIEDISEDFWEKRFNQIINFENHISENGIIVLKFFLHLSKEEQKKRLLRRLDKEKHNWKFSPSDIKERGFWDEYQQYYQEVIAKTSTEKAPWYVIPADNKETARCLVASIIHQQMQKYTDISYPELSDKIKENLSEYREILTSEK